MTTSRMMTLGQDPHTSECRPARTRAVLLLNLGTPDKPDVPSVRRYLAEFLSDPAVIRLPRPFGRLNGLLGSIIARFRATTTSAMYQRIWSESGSPLMSITADQAATLEAALPRGWKVYHAMRYGRPGIVETLERIEADGIEELVVLPMYPQFSGPTTGTALRVVHDFLKERNGQLQVTTRTAWFDDHGYINAQTRLIEGYADDHGLRGDNCYLLFSVHGLPVSYVRRGDPYVDHVNRTVALVRDRMGWPADRVAIAFQSRFGPVAWLEPFTDDTLKQLVRAGEKRVLICPISFTTDCLETLEEIDVRYRELTEAAGADLYLCPALNTYAPFISAMKHLVLRGPRPIRRSVPDVRTYRATTPAPVSSLASLGSLVMIGVSSDGRLERSMGPTVAHTAPSALRAIKRSQCDMPPLLQRLSDDLGFREVCVWNTCHRFELLGWLPESGGARPIEETIRLARRELFGEQEPIGLNVNVLRGAEAWHHVLRTAVGLNSHLPGERDIFEQLQAAHRLAIAASTYGPLSERLLVEVAAIDQSLRDDTGWGRYHANYAYATMARLLPEVVSDPRTCRIVVVGGSTTSAGVMQTLAERFDVPLQRVTLLYRGHKHGGQMKLLRRAIGTGRRVRVHSYDEPRVAETIREADVVVFGLDRNEPVLTPNHLRHRLADADRPLTIFDFNLFGSTRGLEELEGVTLYDAASLEREAAAFADDMCGSPQFAEAVEAVEREIAQRVAEKRDAATGLDPAQGTTEVSATTFHPQAPPSGASPRHGAPALAPTESRAGVGS